MSEIALVSKNIHTWSHGMRVRRVRKTSERCETLGNEVVARGRGNSGGFREVVEVRWRDWAEFDTYSARYIYKILNV